MRNVVRTPAVRALLGSVLALAASVAVAEERVLDRTFTVAPGGLVTVNADGASISVSGSDTDKVVVHMMAEASQKDLDELRMSASKTEDGVLVEMLRPERKGWFDWGSWRVQARIEVTVPRSYRVASKTSGGHVRLEHVAGPSRIRTSGGEIVANHLKGDLDADTSGGDVRLESIEGAIRAHTSGGSIHASAIRGDINADTSGGDVRLLRIDGKIRAHTSGGDVQCELVGSNRGISASTSGGDVRLKLPGDVGGELDARSSGGTITSDFPVATSRWAEHHLAGVINGGGGPIRLQTSGGNITLNKTK